MDLRPDFFFRRVTDIDVSFLKGEGIRALILDIDNTLTYDNDAILPNNVGQWLATIAASNIDAVIVSNNNGRRVKDFAALCGLPYLGAAAKPSRRSLSKVFEILKAQPDETAVIGDQLFTDILYGKRAHCKTILVDKMGEDIPVFVKLKRHAEKPVMAAIRKRGYTKL